MVPEGCSNRHKSANECMSIYKANFCKLLATLTEIQIAQVECDGVMMWTVP